MGADWLHQCQIGEFANTTVDRIMEKNHAIDAGLETLNGLLNSFTDPGNRELFRKEAITRLQQAESGKPQLDSKQDPGAGDNAPEHKAPDLSAVIHEGPLLKKGDWRWHKRFCVLDGLYFRIFNEKGELKPKYVIPLIRLTQVRRDAQNRFIVTPFPEDGPALVLEAEPSKVSEWLLAFQQAREICFPDEAPKTDEKGGKSDGSAESPAELEKRFTNLCLCLKDRAPITGLDGIGPIAGPAVPARAQVDFGLGHKSVTAVIGPATSHSDEHTVVICARFDPRATMLNLSLNLPGVSANGAAAEVAEDDDNVPVPQELMMMDQRMSANVWSATSKSSPPASPKNSHHIEMNSHHNHIEMDTVNPLAVTPVSPDISLSASVASPRSPSSSSGPLNKKLAKKQLAELRKQRTAGEITEEVYKSSKRALLDQLASATEDSALVVANI